VVRHSWDVLTGVCGLVFAFVEGGEESLSCFSKRLLFSSRKKAIVLTLVSSDSQIEAPNNSKNHLLHEEETLKG